MAEWDTSKAKGEMLEVARAWLLLPPTEWDLPDPGAMEPVLGESQVISFIPFHFIRFRVPVHLFVRRFLCHFGMQLYDLTPHGVAHLTVFVTLYECYLGIKPHFYLWWRIFWLNLNKDGDGSMQWIGAIAIQLHNNLKLWYLELSFPTLEKGWHWKWFYLFDPSGLSQPTPPIA
jgi:hypothetical protein